LDMARENGFDVLVTRELDRFARGLAKQLVVESEFKRHGVEVEYILGEYPDTPEGNLNKNIKAVIAEYERLKIRERMTRGRLLAVKQGKVMLHGNKPPYGYRLEDGKLVIYEPEARIVRLIFTWYVIGDEDGKKLSIRAIAKRLTEMRVPTWADTHPHTFVKKVQGWSAVTVGLYLSKETYAGVWYYGRKNSRTKTANPREHWLAVEVPAIVSREVWERAQEQRRQNRELAKRNAKYEYLLGRRVLCGQCGARMSGKSVDKGKYRFYYCSTSQGNVVGDCDSPYFRADHVDAKVWEWVKDLLLEPERLRRRLEKQQAEQEKTSQPLRDRLAVIDDLLTDDRRRLERLLDLYLSGDFAKEMLTDRKARLETTIAALEKERADLVINLESRTISDAQILTIEKFAKKVAEGLEKAENSFESKRQIIDLLDVRVTLVVEDGQKVAYARCLIEDETELPVVSNTTGIACWQVGEVAAGVSLR